MATPLHEPNLRRRTLIVVLAAALVSAAAMTAAGRAWVVWDTSSERSAANIRGETAVGRQWGDPVDDASNGAAADDPGATTPAASEVEATQDPAAAGTEGLDDPADLPDVTTTPDVPRGETIDEPGPAEGAGANGRSPEDDGWRRTGEPDGDPMGDVGGTEPPAPAAPAPVQTPAVRTPAPAPTAPPAPAPAPRTFREQQGRNGVNTFTNPHNASGMGEHIGAAAWVEVSCKLHDPTIASVNPGGYWYRIASAPWSNRYYAPANTFMNGDPWGGPYLNDWDRSVPDC